MTGPFTTITVAEYFRMRDAIEAASRLALVCDELGYGRQDTPRDAAIRTLQKTLLALDKEP